MYFVGSDRVIQCNIRDISARAVADEASSGRLAALELANRSKEDLLAVLSHELRTPLTAISCAADLLELGHDAADQLDKTDVPPQFDRSAVAIIRRNLQAMVRLISELLDLTHMAKGALRLKLERIDAHEVIRLALRNLESWQKLTKVGIYLQLEAQPHHIRADAGKLEQILSNLIGNALKFTPIGGRILIVTRNEGGKLAIEVSDTGIGISAEALGRIFSPFQQGDSSIHPRFGGLGLGLSIARTLTAAHGGTLEVESDGIGKGANFTLRFKVDDSVPQAREEEPRVAAKESRLTPGAVANNGTNHRTKWRSLRPATQTGKKKPPSVPRLGESQPKRLFFRLPLDRINWLTSSFLIGTAALTLTASTALPLVFRAGLVSSCSILRDAERYRI